MGEPATRETGEPGLTEAARRLDRALTRLETVLGVRSVAREDDLFGADRAVLARELDAALARELALQTAAVAASEALGRAADEVRAALGADEAQAEFDYDPPADDAGGPVASDTAAVPHGEEDPVQ